MTAETEKKSKLSSIFAILGFALLLIVAIWSTIQVVKFVPRMFGGDTFHLPSINLGGDDKIKLNISNLNVHSKEPIDISWSFKKKKEGIMSFSYGCEPGFHFRMPSADNTQYTVLPCNAAYNIPSTDNSITVIPVSDSNRYMDASLAITFTDVDGKSVREVASITVTNDTLSNSPDTVTNSTTTKPVIDNTEDNKDLFATPNTNTQNRVTKNVQELPKQVTQVTKPVVRYVNVPTAPYSNPNGLPDLQLKILSVGTIDPYTGAFVPKGIMRINARAAVQFEVANIGDKASGNWTYSAILPTNPRYTYASNSQQSLMPGAKATVVVAFDKLTAGSATVTINIDPHNAVTERSISNNNDSRYFSVY